MEQLRLFISLPIDLGLAKKIHKQFCQLALPIERFRLVQPEQMHLTLKFLGAIPLEKLPEIITTLEQIEKTGQSIDLAFEETIASPAQRPEVIFIKIAKNPELDALYQKIEQSLFQSGFANLETRQFTPHLTLARIKQKIEPQELTALSDWQNHDQFAVNYFELMQSELSPRGPIYTNLQSFDL